MVVSNDFKTKIKTPGRQLDVVICYNGNGGIITEDNKLILTENNMKLITNQIIDNDFDLEINGEQIWRLSKNNLGEICRTYMKSFDLETPFEFNVGQSVKIKLGVKFETDENYTYLDYGIYYVYERTYNEDTKTYTYTLCDDMIRTMIPFKLEYMCPNGETQITITNAIKNILVACGFEDTQYSGVNTIELTDLINGDKIIYKDTFDGLNITCRDVLDMIIECTVSSLIVKDIDNNKLQYTYRKVYESTPTIVETITEDNLSNKNISFSKKFGPLNSLLLSRASDSDNIERKDQTSIDEYGVCQYKISDNLILEQDNRDTYIDNMFNNIKGLTYYINNIDCTGLGYIEYLDYYNVSIEDKIYQCKCLKDTFEVDSGMSESFKTEEPKNKTQEYTSGGIDDKSASILMDKLNGTIVLKTYQEGTKTKIAQVRLDSSGEDGSDITISADNISLEGYTSINDGFHVTDDGLVKIDGGGMILYDNQTTTGGNYCIGIQNDKEDPYLHTYLSSRGISSWESNENLHILTRYSSDLDSKGLNIEDVGSTPGSSNAYNATLLKNGLTFKLYTYNPDTTTTTYYNVDGCYINGPCTATSFNPPSVEEIKKDFEKLDSGLDIIKDIDIYKYRYKDEEDTKKHIGLVIGKDYNYSKDVTNNNNDGVDLYSFVSVCCKAIQEQQEQIEQLKKELEEVKNGRD